MQRCPAQPEKEASDIFRRESDICVRNHNQVILCAAKT